MNEYEKSIEWDEARRKDEEYNNYINSFPLSVQYIFRNCYFDDNLYNWILTKDEAINVLNLFQNNNTKILGIDIIIKKDSVYEYNYDNWSSECSVDSLDENNAEAIKFINEYYSKKDNIYFIVTI